MDSLSATDLKQLIKTAFPEQAGDKKLALLVDVPDETIPDDDAWRTRRGMARSWYLAFKSVCQDLKLEAIDLFYYRNVHSNNAELPEHCFRYEGGPIDLTAHILSTHGQPVTFAQVFQDHQLFLAPTRFSTTAPLKLMAQKYGFRAATMPGFNPLMIPALKLDYQEVNRRVTLLKEMLDEARAADIQFFADGKKYELQLDLRYRNGHASGGVFPDKGTAGNLPSGESYIVPYEGEKGEPSESQGVLPVQFEQEIVLYRIEQNRAIEVLSKGPKSRTEAEKIRREPAYANLAELGFGVLADFGIKPIGEVLLDEKLGLHIAFGRSDHFGGIVGPKDFTSPETVEHSDRIYIPETQNRIQVPLVTLTLITGQKTVMKNGTFTIFKDQMNV